LKLKYDKLLSKFAFNFNLRHYTWAFRVNPWNIEDIADAMYRAATLSGAETEVGQCWFTPGWKHLTPRLLSSVETKMRRIAFKLCFQLQPAPLHRASGA
jgi:hypothetical protein